MPEMNCLRAPARPACTGGQRSLWGWGASPSGASPPLLVPPRHPVPRALVLCNSTASSLCFLNVFKEKKMCTLTPNVFNLDKSTQDFLWENVCPVTAHEHEVSCQQLPYPPGRVLPHRPSSWNNWIPHVEPQAEMYLCPFEPFLHHSLTCHNGSFQIPELPSTRPAVHRHSCAG